MSHFVKERMLAWAAATPDQEVCGLLFGHGGDIDAVALTKNHAPAPDTAFEIDPKTLIAAHKAARVGGPPIVGLFHSHPNGRPEPSVTDAAMANADGAIWIILANEAVTAWQAVEVGDHLGRFTPLIVHVTP